VPSTSSGTPNYSGGWQPEHMRYAIREAVDDATRAVAPLDPEVLVGDAIWQGSQRRGLVAHRKEPQ
jgi:hypothetical protein